MSVTIVTGGQFGSEGKGKVARFFAQKYGASSVVRVGGTNSGHTTVDENGHPVIFRSLPTAALDGSANCILPPGSYVDPEILFREITVAKLPLSHLKVHPNTVIITPECERMEDESGLRKFIGSTASGTGSAVAMRVMRDERIVLAKDVPELAPFLCDTADFLREELERRHEILIEGTQGYGLSNLHSPYYPYATSRDTTAAGFLSECGLSPFDVKHIILVLRSYPIRVSGNSGPLSNELSWDDVTTNAKSLTPVREYTSVTNRLRRVGSFDEVIPLQAIRANRPDLIVLNHLDYIPEDERGGFVDSVQEVLGSRIDCIGTGPDSLSFRLSE